MRSVNGEKRRGEKRPWKDAADWKQGKPNCNACTSTMRPVRMVEKEGNSNTGFDRAKEGGGRRGSRREKIPPKYDVVLRQRAYLVSKNKKRMAKASRVDRKGRASEGSEKNLDKVGVEASGVKRWWWRG